MSFDARDLIEVNFTLLQEAVGRDAPSPAVVVCLATWGRGADPRMLTQLQPYRIGLGYNGSVVARVPREVAAELLPPDVAARLGPVEEGKTPICAEVFRDWQVESW